MSLNWYPRYVGDYTRDTKHLTMLEHGAYNLLLDHYYSTGPLPASKSPSNAQAMLPDMSRIYRIASAVTNDERAAVDNVVEMFFILNGNEFKNQKADKVISEQTDKHNKRVEAGKKRASIAPSKAQAKLKQSSIEPEPEPEDTYVSKPHTPLADAGIDANGRPTRGTAVEFPQWLLEDSEAQAQLHDFVRFRTTIKRPIVTAYQMARLIGQLTRLHDEGQPVAEVIKQSIDRGWEGFYELKAAGPKKSFARRMQDATVAAVQDYEKGKRV